MGYHVEYGPFFYEEQKEKRSEGFCIILGICFFITFLFLTRQFWPQGWEVLCQLIYPGDPSIAVDALENLALELKYGGTVSTALESFCQEILNNGATGSY